MAGTDDPVQIGRLQAVGIDQMQMVKAHVNQVLGNLRAQSADADHGEGLRLHDPALGIDAQHRHATRQKAPLGIDGRGQGVAVRCRTRNCRNRRSSASSMLEKATSDELNGWVCTSSRSVASHGAPATQRIRPGESGSSALASRAQSSLASVSSISMK